MRILYHLIRADFLERARSYGFLIILGLAVLLGFLVNNGTIGLSLGSHSGENNSAWVGTMMALVATFFLSWFGFYLVKNTIQRDTRTGVGQILATTPLGKLHYVAGKALSNFAVLGIMVVILIVAAVVLQLLSSEGSGFDLWKLVSPFLLTTLPALAVVSALAVLFESVSWLSGGFGNVLFFFGWVYFLSVGIENQNDLLDVSAIHVISESMKQVVSRTFPDYTGGFVLGSSGQPLGGTFRWEGIAWTPALLLIRLGWFCVAPFIVLLASLVFHRFDPSRERTFKRKPVISAAEEFQVLPSRPAGEQRHLSLTPLPLRFRFGTLALAELRLLLKGKRWWWYAVQAGLIVACVVAPLQEARQFALPFAWIWPLLVWSSMGTRESLFRTDQIVFSSPHSLTRQLPSVLIAGVIVAMITGSGIVLRLLFTGDWAGVAMWVTAALFIPSFALAAGVWSGSSKLFEVLYLLVWYVGPMSKTPSLDFIATVGISSIPVLPFAYVVVAGMLTIAAYIGRKRRMNT